MSVTEILVIVGGLGVGYWVVSKLFDDLYRDKKAAPPEGAGEEKSVDTNDTQDTK